MERSRSTFGPRRRTGTSSASADPPGGSRFHVFPWREEEGFGDKRVSRPTLYIGLSIGDLTTRTKALVDTGAPRCVFQLGAAAGVGLDLRGVTPSHTVVMLGASRPAVTHTVTLSLPEFNEEWEAEVDFLLEDVLPFGVLGDEGFLNRWAVSFVASEAYFVVEPTESFQARVPLDPYEEMQRMYPDGFSIPTP